MKSEISAFPEFEQAIKTDKLVYLFGTGISSALTGQPYSWWKWITDGIHALTDRSQADALQEELEADPSTTNMISVIGKVLRAAKADGVYDDWMTQSFERNPIQNHALAETLKKLLLPQDVFATTNYDLLLEQATGIGAYSYEQPDLVFQMLDHGLSTHVVHIHGIYDSGRGVDNIVADQAQYERVLNDKGAQFIQNILGTRTLILVGCGQTTEDANIAQFLSFAKEWLKLDRPCYFLYNSAHDFHGMPDNITMVPYGSEYADLPAFLEDLVQVRLQEKIASNPIIARTAYTERQADAYGLSEYHFSNEYLKFCGRETELAQLAAFAESGGPVSWWAVTGQGGAGKSRLAYEFLCRGRADYFSFFLDPNADEADVHRFCPFNNTFIIIDYIKGNEAHIARLIECLMDLFRDTSYKLRLLFLERDNQLLTGSWYQLLESSIAPAHRARFRDCEYNTVIPSREHRFLYLDDLEDRAVLELIGDICKKRGLPKDLHRDTTLREEYRRKFEQLKFRPLFLQLFVEAYIENGCIQVDYRDCQDLLDTVLRREQDRILNSVGGDVVVCGSLIRLLVRAGISEKLHVNELPALYQGDWDAVKAYNLRHTLPGVQRSEWLQSLIGDAEQALRPEGTVIFPRYPDIIKEAMFLYYTDEDQMSAVWNELWENCPRQFAAFLSRVLVDFPNHTVLREMVRSASKDYSNLSAMEARHAILQNEVIHTREEGDLQHKIVHEEYQYWSGAPAGIEAPSELRFIVLKGLDLSTKKLIGWSDPVAYQALDCLAAFPAGERTTPYQIDALLEYTHYFVEKAAKAAEYVIGLTLPLIEALPKDRERMLFWLRLQREQAVAFIQKGKPKKAWNIYTEVCEAADMTDEQMAELYAYFCFSCCQESMIHLDPKAVGIYADELQDMAAAYARNDEPIAFNDNIHYYYLHAKLLYMELVSMASTFIGWKDYGLSCVDDLISEIEKNEMIADFSGLLVGAWTLKVGTDESVTDEQAKTYLARTDELLARYPDNSLLAENALDLWKTFWEFQVHAKVPAGDVERAYALLLRFPRDPVLHDRFHDLLKASEAVRDWERYYSRREIFAGLFENHRLDYAQPPEPDPDVAAEPYVRAHPKVGANAPCPCGSGKKFKKCCRGKGLYD